MKIRRLPRYAIEYLALRGFLFVLDRLSIARSEALVERLADAGYGLLRERRSVARRNLVRAGLATDGAEADRMARASFRHFAVMVVESLKSGQCFNAETWRQRVELDVDPESERLLDDPAQGVILASGHLGNWEIAAQLISFVKPVAGVTRRMNNPFVEKLVARRKPRNRFVLTPRHDAHAGRFLQFLREGYLLALMIDQYPGSRGVRIPFFGIPERTQTSPAMLHLVTGVPLCFAYCLRTGPMRYRMRMNAPLRVKPSGNRARDVHHILTRLNGELEEAIREQPQQYLWAHRRWRDPSPA